MSQHLRAGFVTTLTQALRGREGSPPLWATPSPNGLKQWALAPSPKVDFSKPGIALARSAQEWKDCMPCLPAPLLVALASVAIRPIAVEPTIEDADRGQVHLPSCGTGNASCGAHAWTVCSPYGRFPKYGRRLNKRRRFSQPQQFLHHG